MNEIILKLETKTVQGKSIKTDFKIIQGEPQFGMSKGAYRWWIIRIKNDNFVKRLKSIK
jgi:hypothetical protein